MAGHLLLVTLMYSFYEIKVQGLNVSSPDVLSPVPPTTPGLNVSSPGVFSPVPPTTPGLNVSSPGVFSPVPPATPGDNYPQVWKLVVVTTGCGLSVGIILLGYAALSFTKCTGNCARLSPKANVSSKSKHVCGYVKSLSSGEYLPSGYDETYSIVSYEFSNIE